MNKLQELSDGSHAFFCPGCKTIHRIDSQWNITGTREEPTVSPSVLVNGNRTNPAAKICHSFVREGKIEFLGDSEHALAGQTVPLKKLPKVWYN